MNRPSLQDLINRASTTLINQLGVKNPAIEALASTIAGANYGQYTYQDYLFAQLNPETSSEEWLYLWSARFQVERIPAQPAIGTVHFNQASGVVNVPRGIIIKTPDNKEYEVTTATDSNNPIPVKSVDTGSTFNLTTGVTLSLVSAVTGLNPDTIVTHEISGGSDIEELEHWRVRVVNAFKQKKAVGRTEDYLLWATAAHPDVDFAWALDNTPSTGHVTVYIGQRENDPIVTSGVKSAVENYIEKNRLAGCHITVLNPNTKTLDLKISGVTDQNTRDQIQIALEDFIKTRLGDQQPITPVELVLAITSITTDFSLVSPVKPVSVANNEVLTIGAITWSQIT